MLDPRIILAGQQPDIMGEYARGLETAQMQTEMVRKNALADLYAQQGPQIMAGDPQAWNALAAYDAPLAMELQGMRLGQEATRQDMAINAEDMQMRRDAAKREAEAMLAAQAADLTAAQAAEYRSQMMGILAGGAQAHAQGPQAFAGWLAQSGLEDVSYEQFPVVASGWAGELDALDEWSKMRPEAPKPAMGSVPQGYMLNDPANPAAGMTRIPGAPPSQPGIVVNTGDTGARMGTIPAGYAAVPDPSSPAGVRLVPIPGSEAARDAQAETGKQEARAAQEQIAADTVSVSIARAKDIIKNSALPTTGFGGQRLQSVGGTGANDLRVTLDTIRANIAFDRLQQMRQASPTGGALGAVSDREMALLSSVLGALDQSQTQEQLLANLAQLEGVYKEIKRKFDAYPGATQTQPGAVMRFDANGNQIE